MGQADYEIYQMHLENHVKGCAMIKTISSHFPEEILLSS